MSITDHPGLLSRMAVGFAATFKSWRRNEISPRIISPLGAANPDIKAALLRDFEYNTGLIRNEKEAAKAEKVKTDTNKDKATRIRKVRNGRMAIGRHGRRRNGRNKRSRRAKRKRIRTRKNRRRNRIRNNSRRAQYLIPLLNRPRRAPDISP